MIELLLTIMGIEQNIERGIKIGSQVDKNINTPKRSRALEIIGNWDETIAIATPIEYEDGFQDEYIKAVKEGYFQVAVANHTSQADAVVLAKLTYILTGVTNELLPKDQQLKGFALPLAKSLDNGKQGRFRKLAYEGSRPMIEKYHLNPVLTATQNDITKRGLDSNSSDFIKELGKTVSDGYAIAVLAEGTVEGGRKNPNGSFKGMQEFNPLSLGLCTILGKRYKHSPTLFIPVGIDKGYEIQNPQNGKPTLNSFFAGLSLAGNPKIARIKVGLPIRSDSEEMKDILTNKDWVALNNVIGKRVARLIPEELRGVYK